MAKTKDQPQTKFHPGETVRIITPGDSRYGQDCTVLEVDREDKQVRTEFGWMGEDQLELVRDQSQAAPPANGKPEPNPKLLELSMEQLVHEVTLKDAELRIAKSEAGRARKRCKDVLNQREELIQELIGRDAKAHNMELPLDGEDEDDEDDEDDGE